MRKLHDFFTSQWPLVLTALLALCLIFLILYDRGFRIADLADRHALIAAGLLLAALFMPPIIRFLKRADTQQQSIRGEAVIHILTYVILVLALYSTGVPEKGTDGDVFKRTKEMASILVLFVLAEMAAFIFEYLNRLKQDVRATMSDLESAQLAMKVTTDLVRLHNDVSGPLLELIHSYVRLAPASPDESGASVAARILLRSYLEEEHKDITGGDGDGGSATRPSIPKSVDLSSIIERGQYRDADVSYFATNVGFYATVLSKLVHGLSDRVSKDERVCLAIITNVLPVHWWDWPMERYWHVYKPIEKYRDAQREAVKSGARIDRLVLVASEDEGRERVGPLWTRAFAAGAEKLFVAIRKSADLARRSIGVDVKDQWQAGCIPVVAKVADDDMIDKRTTVYPLYEKSTTVPNGECRQASELYTDEMHNGGTGGATWYIPLSNEELNSCSSGFGGAFDIVFVGTCSGNKGEGDGLWFDDLRPQWALGFLASMSPGSETMFLTAVRGSTLQNSWHNFASVANNYKDRKVWVGKL